MVNIQIDLPESFFQPEVRWGYNITAKQKEIWAIELDLLLQFDAVCRKNNLEYFLDSGTLLGAVRDGHFIPWDDDIDVIMLRKDYDRLVKQADHLFSYPYFFQNAYSDYGFFRRHSQLRNSETCAILQQDLGKATFNQGIFIDVFVLDGVNEDKLEEQQKKRIRYLRAKKIMEQSYSHNPVKRMVKFFLKPFYSKKYGDLKTLYSKLEDVYRNNNDTEYVDKVLFRRDPQRIKKLKRSWFNESVPIEFEGMMFPAPSHFDDILRVYYGDDYLIPKQVTNCHNANGGILFDTDKSYRAYLKM